MVLAGAAPWSAEVRDGTPTLPPPLGIGLESLKYPFPVYFMPLTIEGQTLRMAYMDVPAQGSDQSKTIVLLHGKNMGGYYFDSLIRFLSSKGYRVVVPDQIGWGKSSKPAIAYSFDLLAANTAHLLDELKINKTAVLGHSTGGMLAVRFARSYPDRVSELILEDPVGLEDYRRKIPAQSTEMLYQAELENTDPQKIRRFFANYFANSHPELSEPLADVSIGVTQSGEWPRWAKASALAYQMIYQQPVCYEFDLIKPRTLLVVGEKDRTVVLGKYGPPEVVKTMGNYPELAHNAVKAMPQGEALVISNCGHIPHLEQPSQFHEALTKFLQLR
jgi:pimeloyl-ACP methyl ester carboxylesterase